MADWSGVPRVQVRSSPIHGRGLFALEAIPAGEYIGFYAGRRTRDNGEHVLWVEDTGSGEWLGYDGTNVLRFMNHSARPNGELDGQELYALRDIRPDEEITIDYGEWFDPGA